MTLQAAIEADLPFLRAEAEARMQSTVTVRRITTRTTQNETTGEEVPEWDDVYTGPFRLGGSNAGSAGTTTEVVGVVTLQVGTRVGHFPASTAGLLDGDLIDVTAGENAGTVWRITEADWKDQATARRFPVIAEDRPSEWP